MLVFSALTPHPPLLIPAIGKEKGEYLNKTRESIRRLEEDLYVTHPQVMIVILSHQIKLKKSFLININPQYETDFEKFGDLATKRQWDGAPYLGAKIAQCETDDLPIRLISNQKIDYGASVPLFFLTEHLPNIQVLVIGCPEFESKNHLHFGEILKENIMLSNKRIAIIASGDLSHTLHSDSPTGFKPEGEQFDRQIINLLETRNTLGIAQMDKTLVDNAEQCIHQPLLVLLGIMKNMNYTFKNYSYESPFGVGYLTGNFVF